MENRLGRRLGENQEKRWRPYSIQVRNVSVLYEDDKADGMVRSGPRLVIFLTECQNALPEGERGLR